MHARSVINAHLQLRLLLHAHQGPMHQWETSPHAIRAQRVSLVQALSTLDFRSCARTGPTLQQGQALALNVNLDFTVLTLVLLRRKSA
jgi:hypothetical protein